MPRSRPEKKPSPAALKPALDPMAIMWGQFFKRFTIRMDGSWPVASARDVEEAYGFWRMIPDLERRGCWPFNGPAADRLGRGFGWVDRLGRGFGWHRAAEQILMAAAERLGLDPSPIRESGDICYNLLLRRPRMAYKTTSTLIAYWPHCLGPRLTGLSAQEKETVRKAEGVLARLLVKIRLKPDSGTAFTSTPDLASAGLGTGGKADAGPIGTGAAPAGNWSRPMPYTEMAVRLFKDATKWRLIKSQYGDRLRRTKSRKLHQIRLDGLSQEIQDAFAKR
jgi:hypothetical protein